METEAIGCGVDGDGVDGDGNGVVISGGGDGGAPAGGKPPLNKINLLRHPRQPPDKKEHTNHNDGLSVC